LGHDLEALPDSELMDEAHRLCSDFSIQRTLDEREPDRRRLMSSWESNLEAQLELEREFQWEASLTVDYAEGVRAFMEKRPPVFLGQRSTFKDHT